jgi:hypothetical protein
MMQEQMSMFQNMLMTVMNQQTTNQQGIHPNNQTQQPESNNKAPLDHKKMLRAKEMTTQTNEQPDLET